MDEKPNKDIQAPPNIEVSEGGSDGGGIAGLMIVIIIALVCLIMAK